jgi:hypothetical protein
MAAISAMISILTALALITSRGHCLVSPVAIAMVPNTLTTLAILLTAQAVATQARSIPYVPTTILLQQPLPGGISSLSDIHRDLVYIFSPTGEDSTVKLLALNISSTLNTEPNLQVLSDRLPFLDGAPATTAFTPSLTENGTLIIHSGDCQSQNEFAIWTYKLPGGDLGNAASSAASSAWQRQATAVGSTSIGRTAPYFLGASMSYISNLAPVISQPVVYSYGGMCGPRNGNLTEGQANGKYSNQMLRIAPPVPGDPKGYTANLITSKGPAWTEAGFTLTPLTPSVSNRSGVVTQQSSYVLLGGHTQKAFINMSTAGIWSLPEEAWSFVNIEAPDPQTTTELAIKRLITRSEVYDSVDSRSGHTTVLSEDGNSLVIYGGWVGDISQAATPQLVVLNMARIYGQWKWTIPNKQPRGTGVYGHGAVLLPGNVMMVYGGYKISPSMARVKRQSEIATPNFLNLTTMTWSSTYTNPNHTPGLAGLPPADNGNMRRIGLGVGLGVGVGAIAGAIIIYMCYRRSNKRQSRLSRDETVRALAQDASRFLHGDDEMAERDDGPPFAWAGGQNWYTGGSDPYQQGVRSLGYESLRGNRSSGYGYSHIENTSARKPSSRVARGLYQPTTMRPNMLGATPGHIHPIYEADEDADYHTQSPPGTDSKDVSPEPHTPTSQTYSDPFITPTTATAPITFPSSRASLTPSPEAPQQHDPDVQDWVSELDATDALLAKIPHRNNGRLSTTHRSSMKSSLDDERTASNLSDSDRSAISVARSTSRGSHFRSSAGVSTLLGSGTLGGDGRLGSSGSSSANTFSTAKSTFHTLQAEGPSLLMGGRSSIQDDDDDFIPVPGSPSKGKPRRSWLGSLRRVFSGGYASPPEILREGSPQRMSVEITGTDYESRPAALSGIGGGALLRRKQGRQDWEPVAAGPSSEGDERAESSHDHEDEWDIERAVEQRLVQVMFTVPKERLRVVNAEIEKEEEIVVVDPDKDVVSLGEEEITEEEATPELPTRNPFRSVVVAEDEDDTEGKEPEEQPSDFEKSDEHLHPPDEELNRQDSSSIHTAEAVRFEKPRTRVLEMVETIESFGRDGSPLLPSTPTGSPGGKSPSP